MPDGYNRRPRMSRRPASAQLHETVQRAWATGEGPGPHPDFHDPKASPWDFQRFLMIYVITDFDADLTHFIFEGVQRDDVRLVHYPAKVQGVGQKIRRWLEAIFPVVPLNIYGPADFINAAKGITQQDVVVLFSIMNAKDLQLLKKHLKRSTIYLFLWNPVVEFSGNKARTMQRLKAIRAVSDHVTTFDAQDARNYGFSLLPQPFRYITPQENADEAMDYDFCFIGMDKGRLPFLMRFKILAEQMGFRCFFRIVPDKGVAYSDEERAFLCDGFLSYEDNLRHVARSRCLLEIVQHNQFGSTMRSVEALFFNKKIITTNPSAREEPGFDDRRVLVLDGGHAEAKLDMRDISAFMQRPLGSPGTQAMQAHEINQWLNHFAP